MTLFLEHAAACCHDGDFRAISKKKYGFALALDLLLITRLYGSLECKFLADMILRQISLEVCYQSQSTRLGAISCKLSLHTQTRASFFIHSCQNLAEFNVGAQHMGTRFLNRNKSGKVNWKQLLEQGIYRSDNFSQETSFIDVCVCFRKEKQSKK